MSLPDVVSAFIPLFKMMSAVVSFTFIVGEDAEANKVEFVLIDVSGELTETLICNDIVLQTILCLVFHIIHIYDMYSYIFIYVSMLELWF